MNLNIIKVTVSFDKRNDGLHVTALVATVKAKCTEECRRIIAYNFWVWLTSAVYGDCNCVTSLLFTHLFFVVVVLL